MSRRYWLPLIAVVGLALASGAYAQGVGNNATSKPSATRSSAKPKTDAPPSIPVAVQNDIHGIATELHTANQNSESPEEKDSAKRNLQSQEDMAKWAGRMFGVGLGEMLVTLAGVILVWRTLRATWASQKEAKRAADAAHKMIEAMDATARKQLRAYITIDEVEVSRWDDNSPVVFKITVQNTGQTPAKHAAVRHDTKVVSSIEDRDFTNETTGIIDADITIGAGKSRKVTLVSEAITITAAAAAQFNRILLAYGFVTYQDVFGETHTTRFCAYFRKPYLGEKTARYYRHGNSSD